MATETDWANEDMPFRVRYRRVATTAGNRSAGAYHVYCASEAEAEQAVIQLREQGRWAVRVETREGGDES